METRLQKRRRLISSSSPPSSYPDKKEIVKEWIKDVVLVKDPVTLRLIPPSRRFYHIYPNSAYSVHDCLSLRQCIVESDIEYNPLNRIPFNKVELKRLARQCKDVTGKPKNLVKLVRRRKRQKVKQDLYSTFVDSLFSHIYSLKDLGEVAPILTSLEKLLSAIRVIDGETYKDLVDFGRNCLPTCRSAITFMEMKGGDFISPTNYANSMIANHNIRNKEFRYWLNQVKLNVF